MLWFRAGFWVRRKSYNYRLCQIFTVFAKFFCHELSETRERRRFRLVSQIPGTAANIACGKLLLARLRHQMLSVSAWGHAPSRRPPCRPAIARRSRDKSVDTVPTTAIGVGRTEIPRLGDLGGPAEKRHQTSHGPYFLRRIRTRRAYDHAPGGRAI